VALEPGIYHYAVIEQEMYRRKLFGTSGIRVISESTSQAQTEQLIARGQALVQSLVEAST